VEAVKERRYVFDAEQRVSYESLLHVSQFDALRISAAWLAERLDCRPAWRRRLRAPRRLRAEMLAWICSERAALEVTT
jgi:hypothetical protein